MNRPIQAPIQYTFTLWVAVILGAMSLSVISCSDDETYAEQKERERDAINAFLGHGAKYYDKDGKMVISVDPITVIDEDQFMRQDTITNLERNEYVLFGNTGVYMQLVRRGVGDKLTSGKTKRVYARYIEYNIMGDSVQSTNYTLYYSTTPEVIDITNTSGTFTASFNTLNGGGAMYRYYGSTEVPAGWLVPFTYIHLGRRKVEGDDIAKVRLIVPHTKGTSRARQYVYPCFYEIEFQEGPYN